MLLPLYLSNASAGRVPKSLIFLPTSSTLWLKVARRAVNASKAFLSSATVARRAVNASKAFLSSATGRAQYGRSIFLPTPSTLCLKVVRRAVNASKAFLSAATVQEGHGMAGAARESLTCMGMARTQGYFSRSIFNGLSYA
eukprot:gene31772-6973_t